MSSDKPENPSAFPHQHRASDSKIIEQYSDYGLTMRDYFAAAALQGILAKEGAGTGVEWVKCTALEAYQYADHMLAERSKS